ncbi:MAG: precorrin-2 C(20)-methyltransferase [Pseudomonadota bacterium]
MTGTLWGVGLGPGDPELLTLKAHRLITSATVIAYPAPAGGQSFARAIAAAFIPATAREIAISVPMQTARFPAQAVYDRAAADIAQHLDDGRDVVTLCEGDPFFYGSFMYLYTRLAARYPCVTVPGVTSMTAAAAAAGRPLCARNEELRIVPAPLAEDVLQARLATPGAVAILKVGRHLAKVRRVVERLGRAAGAVYLSHATLPGERVLPLADAPETAPYFSLILLPGDDPYGQ